MIKVSAHSIILRLKKNKGVLVGGNIGKNTDTKPEDYTADYKSCFKTLHPYVDYFVVNVSSPNTPGLRELQNKGPLLHILKGIQKKNLAKSKPKPILLKIAPDLNNDQLDDIVEIVIESNISGIVATNTTIERNLKNSCIQKVEKIGAGGLSGKALTEKSLGVVQYLRKKAGKNMTIIGVGGIFTPDDAENMINAGADLVQIFTGFIYEGPSLVKDITNRLNNQ